MLALSDDHFAARPRTAATAPASSPFAATTQSRTRVRTSTRCSSWTIVIPAPSPAFMHQVASDATPTSPYAQMRIPFFAPEEMAATSSLNKRNYQSLADSIGFDSVVLKQRESDRALQSTAKARPVGSGTSSMIATGGEK